MSKNGRYSNNSRPQRNNTNNRNAAEKESGFGWKDIVLIIEAIMLLAIIGFSVFAYFKVQSWLHPVVTEPEPVIETTAPTEEPENVEATEATAETEPPVTEPDYGTTGKLVNVLVVGESSREGEESKLSDTIMLCTLNKETKKVTVTSFLRDSYVQLATPYVDSKGTRHTAGANRINTSYALGYMWGGTTDAMNYMKATIQNNFGVEIDYSVEINFEAFEEIIYQMGGLKLELDAEEVAYMNEYFKDLGIERKKDFKVGKNQMDGWECLVYARMRHSSNADNDFKRTSRQRIVIEKLLEKCRKRNVLQLTSIAKAVIPYIATDMSDKDMATLMLEIIPILSQLEMEGNQCPAPGTFWGEMVVIADVESGVLKMDVQKNRELLMAIAEADKQ